MARIVDDVRACARLELILAACAVVPGVDLFVHFYEEPKLRNLFGAEYEE